ncbi:MAG: phosphatidylserine/phosphatidylglycerophosphate/cardiolipin synthase family protein [Deltaproteobacteria bacterium]|nr:phosphatidylserine/phosphatidylglycerophosphate/cardiolipin synthase family protein [Deltaproteobacteria bacterium]
MPEGLRLELDPRQIVLRDLPVRQRLRAAWRVTLARLLPLGGASDGNDVTLFFDGDSAYDAMLGAIAAATQRVWLETYIFEPDRAGRAFLNALAAAARRGVDVLLLYDVVGSPHLSDEVLRPLKEAGAEVVAFNPLWRGRIGARRPLPFLHRDHRKILVADDAGFCGGMNIAEDYAGPKHGNGRFRDTHAGLLGPCVADLADILRASVRTAGGPRLPAVPAPPPQQGGVFLQVLGSDVRRRRRHIQRALFHTVRRAVSTCFLTTPYFVPPPRLVRALVHARRRGVDVRVLTAGVSDVPMVAAAARHLYGKLLRAGVRIFEMSGKTLHAKTATIDGLYASVGSFNLDRWSFGRNLEVSFAAVGAGLAQSLEQRMTEDLALSREVQPDEHEARGLWQRIVCFVAYQLMRL